MLDSKHIRTKAIISGLKSADEKVILSAIEEMRIHGNVDILPELFVLISSNPSDIITESAIKLLNDLKEPMAVPLIVNALSTLRANPNYCLLVSSCWQNGLDFSPYLSLFVDLILNETMEVAIEAYSVIDENIHNLDDEGKRELAELINKSTLSASYKYNTQLLQELLNSLKITDDYY